MRVTVRAMRVTRAREMKNEEVSGTELPQPPLLIVFKPSFSQSEVY